MGDLRYEKENFVAKRLASHVHLLLADQILYRASYISYVSGVFVSVFQWPQCCGALFGI